MLPYGFATSLVADREQPADAGCVGGQGKEIEVHDAANSVGPTHGRRPEVAVRAVAPGDEDRLRRMFSRLSGRSIYQRFHAPYPSVPEWAVALFTEVDGHRRRSLVAVAGDEIVGHALYVRSDYGHDAEMAVLVEDGWQSNGVGRLLVSELARSAASRDVEIFTGEALGENQRALGLVTSVFAGTRYTLRGGAYHVRMPLRAPGPAANPAGTVPRAA
jgi:GNAT superfamily N-acetyltransferase